MQPTGVLEIFDSLGNPFILLGLRSTKTKAYYPGKDKKENKIDGIVAAIMALSRAKLHDDSASVYEKRGFIEL